MSHPNSSNNGPNGENSHLLDVSLFEELELTPQYAPASLALPVDRELIKNYVAGRIDERARKQVSGLISTFFTWHEAWVAIVREEWSEGDIRPADSTG